MVIAVTDTGALTAFALTDDFEAGFYGLILSDFCVLIGLSFNYSSAGILNGSVFN